MMDVCQVGLHAPIPTWGDMDLSPILGDSPGSTAHNVPGNIFTTDGDAEHFPPPQKWRRQIPLPSRAARSAEEMAERRRLFLRPECKFRGLQPYMDGEESRDAGWRRAGLMAAAQRGDADAYGELLNEIGPVLMRFLRARVRDAQEAEDLYQETLMAIHRARHGYDAARPFEPWLFAIARHIVAAHAERHRVRQAREVLVAAPPERPAESDGHLKPSSSRRFAASPASSARRSRSSGSRGFRSRRRPAAGMKTGALRVRFHRAYKMLRQLL